MAEYELVEERVISGKGVLRVPQQEKLVRHYILYVDVIRKPTNEYLNLNYNPPRSRYAWMVFERDEYVSNQLPLEFESQLWDFVSDVTSQNLIAIKCAYQGILETFVNLGAALPIIFPTTLENSIKDYESLDLYYDTIKVVCYANTAVQLRLYKLEHDTCDSGFDDKKKPPPPPPPRPPVPPGTPIEDISPPYPGDEDNTEPFPGDGEPPSPFPSGEPCQRLRIRLSYTAFGSPATGSTDVFGPILGIRLRQKPAPAAEHFIEVECRGLAFGSMQCQPAPVWARFNSAGGTDVYSNLELISITPI